MEIKTVSTVDLTFQSPDGIIIIGYGVVGFSTGKAIGVMHYMDSCESNVDDWGFKNANCFILCVPTPTDSRGKQDLSAIEYWLAKIKAENGKNPLIIIRSTVLPGTTDILRVKYKLNIVHVPEFLTESTALEDARYPEFLVVGTHDLRTREKIMYYLRGIEPRKGVIHCDPTTAEMIKYAMNCFFALKVIYANEIWDACDVTGAKYDIVREVLEGHKWGAKHGWDIWHGGKRGYAGKCLPKDILAVSTLLDMPLMKTVHTINKKLAKQANG